jgi:hypothetical protein
MVFWNVTPCSFVLSSIMPHQTSPKIRAEVSFKPMTPIYTLYSIRPNKSHRAKTLRTCIRELLTWNPGQSADYATVHNQEMTVPGMREMRLRKISW